MLTKKVMVFTIHLFFRLTQILNNCMMAKRTNFTINGKQFLPVLVGNLKKEFDCYVYINEINYKVENATKAIDICFKASQVLNAKYSEESLLPWTFIQQFIYEITTKYDKRSAAISALISDLR